MESAYSMDEEEINVLQGREGERERERERESGEWVETDLITLLLLLRSCGSRRTRRRR